MPQQVSERALAIAMPRSVGGARRTVVRAAASVRAVVRRAAALAGQPLAGGRVLGGESIDQRGDRCDLVDPADALAAAPDVAPRLGRAAAEVHLRWIAGRQAVRIEAGVDDRRSQ